MAGAEVQEPRRTAHAYHKPGGYVLVWRPGNSAATYPGRWKQAHLHDEKVNKRITEPEIQCKRTHLSQKIKTCALTYICGEVKVGSCVVCGRQEERHNQVHEGYCTSCVHADPY